ncbi:hypothetical protein VHEMI10137 [[Torrubiella] hemipterigena]|uniref:Uncharacterized protein n=1 Tax=[Torrubiella] hemipterigena TaxID=1531966 RepID=A0A0A1TRM7_9HYPO|nr:hypothetical protein VHEMI10137 [[Torrubiella] hemipterigena]
MSIEQDKTAAQAQPTSQLTTYKVAPQLPTALSGHRSVSIPATDLNFYPHFPLHCGVLKRDADGFYSARLANRPVELIIGTSDHPGPFAQDWVGEEHPDYQFSLGRVDVGENEPLFQVKVTTYSKTGQTSIFVSQSYLLGDGFNVGQFMRTWSDFYQQKTMAEHATFEKKLRLARPKFNVRGDFSPALTPISHMTVDFDPEFLVERHNSLLRDTVRVDIDIPGDFIKQIHERVKQTSPVRALQQHITIRNRPMRFNDQLVTIPSSSQGNLYIVRTTPLETATERQTPATHAQELFEGRRALKSPELLGQAYMLYNSFYEESIRTNRMFVECGFDDIIGLNWIPSFRLCEPDFGYHHQGGMIEWESLINFIQAWQANAVIQQDGEF